MAISNSAELGFEKEIWKAADIMRGNMDAAEYKHVILGLIFLKYISDRFEHRYKELLKEGDGFEEGRLTLCIIKYNACFSFLSLPTVATKGFSNHAFVSFLLGI